MTETEWLGATNPRPLYTFLQKDRGESRRRRGKRRLRLFACACVRGIWDLLRQPGSRQALYYGERFAEGLATDQDLATATTAARRALAAESPEITRSGYWWQSAEAASHVVAKRFDGSDHQSVAHAASSAATAWALYHAHSSPEQPRPGFEADKKTRQAVHAEWLRDIFGNPFRPLVLNPALLTPDILALAQAGYENRLLSTGELERDRLAILADALEEVGCTDVAILDHFRGSSSHVRGCHVLDALLGKS